MYIKSLKHEVVHLTTLEKTDRYELWWLQYE